MGLQMPAWGVEGPPGYSLTAFHAAVSRRSTNLNYPTAAFCQLREHSQRSRLWTLTTVRNSRCGDRAKGKDMRTGLLRPDGGEGERLKDCQSPEVAHSQWAGFLVDAWE